MARAIRITAAVLVLFVAATARAQTVQEKGRFLAVDLSGGFVGLNQYGSKSPDSENNRKFDALGGEASASVRLRPWFGIVGAVARTSSKGLGTNHYLAGVRVTDSYRGYQGVRWFAHALAGRAAGAGNSGSELVAGVGLDAIYVARLQFDYVRSNVKGLPKNNVRLFFGGVVPLCFRGCRPNDIDGFNLSRR